MAASRAAAGRVRFTDDLRRNMREALNSMGALLLGRLTHGIWVRCWPTVNDPSDEIARMLNSVPEHVASRGMREGSWSKTTVIDHVPGQLGELEQQPGEDIVVIGSARLAQSLLRHQVVGEYRLMIHPVVLGTGKRLFRDGTPVVALRLIEAVTTTLVTLKYEPAARGSNGRIGRRRREDARR
jgi:dihydrofolate reductase